VLLALSGAVVTAQSAPRHFRYERPIVTSGAGSYRLAVDAELLAGGAPFAVVPRPAPAPGEPEWAATGGLADLRLFDATNREVPYLLVRPPAARTWMHGALLAIASTRTQTRRTSGFEADLGAAVIVDRIRVTGLPSPFLKRLSLEASGDREHWTLVAAEATLFDLPDQDLRQLELPFAAGAYRYLRVTWDDTSSGQMSAPREVSARRVDATATRPPTASLVAERRPSEPGRSRYVIRLPGPHMPVAALRLDVGPGHVLRPAEVTESRLTGVEAAPAVLGRATLRQVLVGAVTASNLRIPITPPAEAQLDLVIDDGDNSPLPAVGVVAEFAELPWIYFESDGSPLVARYGSAGAEPPRYDLEAVRETLRIDSAREAQWASAKALPPPADAAPAPLPVTGAAIDAALFRHRRDVPAGNAGLVALPLDEAILAESAGPARGFADLRVIDGRGRQVPYLLERRDEPLSLDLALTPTTSAAVDRSVAASGSHTKSRGPLTTYRITLPYHSLPSAKLVLGTDARVFAGCSSASNAGLTTVFARIGWKSWPAAGGSTPIANVRRLHWCFRSGPSPPRRSWSSSTRATMARCRSRLRDCCCLRTGFGFTETRVMRSAWHTAGTIWRRLDTISRCSRLRCSASARRTSRPAPTRPRPLPGSPARWPRPGCFGAF
jgi:hypothetical protein